MTLDRQELSERLIDCLNKLYGATSSGVDEEIQKNTFQEFFDLLNEMEYDLLPYAAASQFLYNNIKNGEGFYLIQSIEDSIKEEFDVTDEIYKKGLKIVEHLELAQQQKEALFAKQEEKIHYIEEMQKVLLDKSKKVEELQKTTEDLQEANKKLQEENAKMTTNYITILGIFAAILMGAFGSIQGFTSIYENAYRLELFEVLIISSIGASSVILILFFLLNGVAKLTGKSLSSSKRESATLTERHPTLIIVHMMLVLLCLIAVALKLSNVNLNFAWEGLWWLLPIFWFIYILNVIKSK
ncbi:hypothetical protein ACFO3D_09180 [Virgibacillus kekensis]|uniref:Uncharacterized protein n=1 Tax=Virgibacillus kekensis TaxID=202261 RepID=A0ABV9DJZ6_9BACI